MRENKQIDVLTTPEKSEEGFAFATADGKVQLTMTDDVLAPYGGLVPLAAFAWPARITSNWGKTVRSAAHRS